MSVTTIERTQSIKDSVEYVVLGKGEKRKQTLKNHTTRAKALFCSCPGGLNGFIKYSNEVMKKNPSRRIKGFNIIQSFPDNEFDYKNQDDIDYCNGLGVELATRLYPDSHFAVVTHTDGDGHKVHNHIIVINDVLSLGTSIKTKRDIRFVRAINDKLMRDVGLSTVQYGHKDFTKQKNGQFNIDLTKKIDDALKHSTELIQFIDKLDKLGVSVKVKRGYTHEPVGITYSMVDKNNKKKKKGKLVSAPRTRHRKGSTLGREYTYQSIIKQINDNCDRAYEERQKRLREAKKRQYEQIKKRQQLEQQENISNTSKKREKNDKQETQKQVIIKRVHIADAVDALQDNTASNDKQAIQELTDVGESSPIKKAVRRADSQRPQRVKNTEKHIKQVKKHKKQKIELPTVDIESIDNLLYLNNENQKTQDENQKH